MSRMAVLTLANCPRTFSKVMGFARAQPILRANVGQRIAPPALSIDSPLIQTGKLLNDN